MNEQTVTVMADPAQSKVTFIPDGPIEFAIPQEQRGRVIFNLQFPTGSATVNFPSDPIQWVDDPNDKHPIDPPSVATVTRLNDSSSSIEIKSLKATKSYYFFVIVQTTDGKFFGSDPTIVTMRPDV
jgi:hypothetical protein